jgi:hypothetical protein
MPNIVIPTNGRVRISDATATPVVLVIPYTNGDFAESGDTDNDGYETEVVYARDIPIGAVPGKRSGKQFKFSAVMVDPSATNTIDDLIEKKTPYNAPVSTAPSGTLSTLTHYTVDWQVNIAGTWTTVTSYKYCLLKKNRKEGSPTGMIDVSGEAIAYDSSWKTETTS